MASPSSFCTMPSSYVTVQNNHTVQSSIYGQATLVKLSSNWTSLSRLFQTMKFQLNHEKTICNKEKGQLRGKANHLERPPPTDAMPSTVMGTVTIQPIMNMNSWTLITTKPPSKHAFGSLPSVSLSPQVSPCYTGAFGRCA